MSRQSSSVHPQGGDRVLALDAGTTALSSEVHANRLLTLSDLDDPYTLNLPRAFGTGDVYEFLSTGARTSGSIIINAVGTAPSNRFVGTIWQRTSASTLVQFSSTVNDIITLNITTTGGAGVGDYLKIQDTAPAQWRVIFGLFTTSGAQATPFSG